MNYRTLQGFSLQKPRKNLHEICSAHVLFSAVSLCYNGSGLKTKQPGAACVGGPRLCLQPVGCGHKSRLPHVIVRKQERGCCGIAKLKTIPIKVYYPQSEEGRQELARRAAQLHAQVVLEKIQKLDCPAAQKQWLLKKIYKKVFRTDDLAP